MPKFSNKYFPIKGSRFMQLISFFTGLLTLSFLMSSCNYFSLEKKDRHKVKKEQLESLRKKKLENYPEIYPCYDQENPKICFERQLNEHLGTRLEGIVVNESEITKDTLWLTVHVSNTGQLSIKSTKNIKEEYAPLYDTIRKSLKDISLIKPAFIDGVTVSCNFKLPLIIKNTE